jgi:hypothetical protein
MWVGWGSLFHDFPCNPKNLNPLTCVPVTFLAMADNER